MNEKWEAKTSHFSFVVNGDEYLPRMKLENLLSEKKPAILNKWFDVIMETYPAETSLFLKSQSQFGNPVGHAVRQGIEGIFEELLSGADSSRLSTLLDNIIRIRAVQDFTPSQATTFIVLLKGVIRKELGSEIRKHALYEELLRLEDRIDAFVLIAFDIYMKCREKLYQMKSDEAKRLTFRLLQRAKLICEPEEQ